MNLDKDKFLESLSEVGRLFPDVEDSVLKGYFPIETFRLSKEKEVLRCIKMYSILKDVDKLTGRKLEVLVYYLLYGFSKKTKKDIIKGLDITDSNLNNINCELRKMKLINSVGYNQATNEVSKDLIKFKEFIVDNKGKYILIKMD